MGREIEKREEFKQDNLEKSQKYSALLTSFTKELAKLNLEVPTNENQIIEEDMMQNTSTSMSSSTSDSEMAIKTKGKINKVVSLSSKGDLEEEDFGNMTDTRSSQSNEMKNTSVTTISSNHLTIQYLDFESRLDIIFNTIKEYKNQKEAEYTMVLESNERKSQELKDSEKKMKELNDMILQKDRDLEAYKASVQDNEREIQINANNQTEELAKQNTKVVKELQEMKLMYDAGNMEASNEIKTLAREKRILVDEIKRIREDIKKEKSKIRSLATAYKELKDDNVDTKKRLEDADNLLLMSVHKEEMMEMEKRYKQEVSRLSQELELLQTR